MTSEGSVFGGYSDAPWNIYVGLGKSPEEAFLFSLKCNAGLVPTKVTIKLGNNKNSVYHSSDHGNLF